jgi:hypothetical protein
MKRVHVARSDRKGIGTGELYKCVRPLNSSIPYGCVMEVQKRSDDGLIRLIKPRSGYRLLVTGGELDHHFREIEATHVCVRGHHYRGHHYRGRTYPCFRAGDRACFVEETLAQSVEGPMYDCRMLNLETGDAWHTWSDCFAPVGDVARAVGANENVFREEGGEA